ncbi:hypothetical protein U1Q18_029616 [Sarracenia purpurea var. burkii]
MRLRGFMWSNLARCLKDFEHFFNLHSNMNNQRPFLHSTRKKTIFSDLRSFSTELQPQLSSDLVKIMEKRLSAIEHRSAYLSGLINQVTTILGILLFSFDELYLMML